MGKPYVRLDKDNAAVLLVDHQTGLLSLVRDIDPDKNDRNDLAARIFNRLILGDVALAKQQSQTAINFAFGHGAKRGAGIIQHRADGALAFFVPQ